MNRSFFKSIRPMALILAVLTAFSLLTVSAGAATDSTEGLIVEQLNFRDILRLYDADPSSFGENALETDASGITNAAKSLAALFTYTVGLNYNGEGLNCNYFGKDITSKMESEPYTEANLQATYDVDIYPYRSYAQALPKGKTTSIYVYLTGYVNAANGVEPVLNYVWEDGGKWYAVKDDNCYYRVSYDGANALDAASDGAYLCMAEAASGGTDTLGSWKPLWKDTEDGVIQTPKGTILAGDGTANIFGMTRDPDTLMAEGGYSSALCALSDFVQGGTTYQTGPLVAVRDCYVASTMERVKDGERLSAGTKYLYRLVYDESLTVEPGCTWSDASIDAAASEVDETAQISDFVWYGSEDYLDSSYYNPRTVEFCYTPSEDAVNVCTVRLENLVGDTSALSAAPVHACLTESSTPAVTAEASAEPEATAAPTAEPTEAPTASPTAEPTAAATATAEPTPASTAEPTATPAAGGVGRIASETVSREAASSAALTRADAAMALWQRSGCPEIGQLADFSDLPSDSTTATAISWAAQKGLIVGYGDGTFGPQAGLTREQSAVLLSRYAAMLGKNAAAATGSLNAYSDGVSVSSWAQAAVIWALKEGYLSADNGSIRPQGAATVGGFNTMLTALESGH